MTLRKAAARPKTRPSPLDTRAFNALWRGYREHRGIPWGSPEWRSLPRLADVDLLAWAETVSDEYLMSVRNLGARSLEFIRKARPLTGSVERITYQHIPETVTC